MAGLSQVIHCRFRLSERETPMTEEDAAGIGELDAASAADHQLRANFIF
jgi:hypothetical protein